MKRLILALALAAGLCFAQEHGKEQKAGHAAAGEEGGLEIWKWVNFLILAGGLGYLIGKNAGPFFAARSANIRKDMEESLRLRKEAEASVAEVDERLALLDKKIAALRAEGEQEFQRAAEKISRQIEADVAKVQAHALQEIESAGKVAHAELKRYSAELALRAAEQKIRARMTPAAQTALVDSFVSDLK
jgi:F0F1-type ATP synthase membrane subunit b/b'